MELKNLSTNIVKCPKKTELKNNKIQQSIPGIWKSIGINMCICSLMMKKVLASDKSIDLIAPGGLSTSLSSVNPVHQYMSFAQFVCGIVSIITFLIGLINYFKEKNNEDVKKQKYKKLFKTALIFAVIVGIIAILFKTEIIPESIWV